MRGLRGNDGVTTWGPGKKVSWEIHLFGRQLIIMGPYIEYIYIYLYIYIFIYIYRERETLSATVLDASIYRVLGKVDWNTLILKVIEVNVRHK